MPGIKSDIMNDKPALVSENGANPRTGSGAAELVVVLDQAQQQPHKDAVDQTTRDTPSSIRRASYQRSYPPYGDLEHVSVMSNLSVVMAGLVPAIHPFFPRQRRRCAGQARA